MEGRTGLSSSEHLFFWLTKWVDASLWSQAKSVAMRFPDFFVLHSTSVLQ